MTAEAAVALALERAAVYAILACAFGDPDPARVQALAERAGVAARRSSSPARAEALARLSRAAAAADGDALAREHAALFDGAVACPPYEGAWGPQPLGGKGTMLADVAGFHAAFGLTIRPWNADLEDHVAAECELMSALALKEAWARAQDRAEARDVTVEAEAAFLRDHLGRWAGAFAEEVRRRAAAPLYREAAALLSLWIAEDAARLGVTPSAVRGLQAADPAPMTCPMAPGADD